MGFKYLTNTALAVCQLSYATKPRVIVGGSLPAEFTHGKISKHWCGGQSLETVDQEFPKENLSLYELKYPWSKTTNQIPIRFEVRRACIKKTQDSGNPLR